MANRKQGITRTLAYLTSQLGRRAQEKRKKGVIFRGNKANRLFRMSNLIQKWSENKPNLHPDQLECTGRQSWPPKNKAILGLQPEQPSMSF